MRFDKPLNEILGTRSKVALLRVLLQTEGEYTGRDLARLVDVDHKACYLALNHLVDEGIVRMRRIGQASAYSLNRDHAAMEMLKPLFEKERALFARFVQEVGETLYPDAGARKAIDAIVLFGSVARGEQRKESDVDLFVLVRTKEAAVGGGLRVAEVMTRMVARYGSVPQVFVESTAEFRASVKRGDPFRGEVVRTGRVVQGKEFEELLRNDPANAKAKRRAK